MTGQERGQQGAGIEAGLAVVTLLVHLARKFLQVQRLQGLCQRLPFAHAFEVGARALCVFADPVLQPRRHRQRACGQHFRQRRLRLAAEIERGRDQVELAGCRHAAPLMAGNN